MPISYTPITKGKPKSSPRLPPDNPRPKAEIPFRPYSHDDPKAPTTPIQNGWHRVTDSSFAYIRKGSIRSVAVSVDGELAPARLLMADGPRWVPAIPPENLASLRRGVERGAYRIVR